MSGGPRERGVQYGAQARDRILLSRAAYERAFDHAAGWTWAQAVRSAAQLVDAVARAYPRYLAEMEGMAEGSGLSFDDIFTMNSRTEVMWAATVRSAQNERAEFARECSSFALLPSRTATRRTYVGENWDWLADAFDSLIVLEVEQPDRPNFVTVVEAGLLAKASMNSAGLGVVVNALVTSLDRGGPGLPFHVLLRAFADCESLTEAIYVATQNPRASSGNYLLAHADGLAVNLETTPGDYRGVTAQLPERGALIHTNHFRAPTAGSDDVGYHAMADSLIRLQRIQSTVAENDAPATVESLRAALSDHADFPSGVCCHPDTRRPQADHWATVMSVIMDLDDRAMYLSDGNPCAYPYRRLSFTSLLDKPSDNARMRADVEAPVA